MSGLKILKFLPLILIFGLVSCTDKLQFSTSISPSVELNSIRTLAIGDVRILQNDELNMHDQLGNWTVRQKILEKKGLKKFVKLSLISNLSRFSDYNIVDLAEFSKMFNDELKSIKPVGGMSIKEIDAVLNLKIAVRVVTQNGQFERVKSFSRRTSRKVGKKWKTVEHISQDRKITEPYQTRTASIFMTGELVKVSGGKIRLLKTFSEVSVVSMGSGFVPGSFTQSVDGNFLPFFNGDNRSKEEKIGNLPLLALNHETLGTLPNGSANMSYRMALQISNMILPKFARYTVLATRTIDSGGDEAAVNYLKQARVMKAKEKIEEIISSTEDKSAENLYNLGICYEALGEPRIAIQLYEEALRLDEANSNVIEALGALQNKIL